MDIQWLGRIGYADGLELQNDLVEKRQQGLVPDTVLLLEHDPVYTIGRTKDKTSLQKAAHLPHPVFETNRGGQATYHGPGQLVGYLILDLVEYGKDLHTYLRQIERFLVDFTSEFGINASSREGLTGVWVGNRKLASIGVGVRKWVSMHGFGLNISRDLSGYSSITPCGIENVEMTSLEIESQEDISVRETATAIEPFICRSLQSLRDTVIAD